MRLFLILVLMCAGATQTACGGGGSAEKTADTNRPAAATTLAHGPSANVPPASSTAAPAAPPVASSHGASAPAVPPAAGQGRAGVDTAALDAKIAGALAKAKAPQAGAAEKAAAAAAYLERANVYWSAGDPTLYKFALADFKSVLVYDPANAEAATKRDEIIRIYRSMGRPVPELSNEK